MFFFCWPLIYVVSSIKKLIYVFNTLNVNILCYGVNLQYLYQ